MEPGERKEAGGSATAEEAAGPVFTLEEVGKRNSSREAWLVIHGRVYDVTRFLEEVEFSARMVLHLIPSETE